MRRVVSIVSIILSFLLLIVFYLAQTVVDEGQFTCPVIEHKADWLYVSNFQTTGEAYADGAVIKCITTDLYELDVPLLTITVIQSYTGMDYPSFDSYDLVIEFDESGKTHFLDEQGPIENEVYSGWTHFKGLPFVEFNDNEGNSYLYLLSGRLALVR